MHEAEVKEALSKRLRRPDIENLWAHLLDRSYVAEVLEGTLSIDDLVEEAKAILQPAGRAVRRTESS